MYSPHIEEQLLRCDRALRRVMRFRDPGVRWKDLRELDDEDLADRGLTRADLLAFRDEDLSQSYLTAAGMPASLQRAYRINNLDFSIPDFTDAVIFFFQQCFHLRDWIAHCPTSSVKRSALNEVVRSTELSICADFANGTKHLKLTSEPWSGKYQGGTGAKTQMQDGVVRVLAWYVGEDRHDVFELAPRCMAIWREFLSANVPQVPEQGEPAKISHFPAQERSYMEERIQQAFSAGSRHG